MPYSPLSCTFHRFSLFLITLIVLRNTNHVYIEFFSIQIWFLFVSWSDGGTGFWEGHRSQVPFLSLYAKGTVTNMTDSSLLMLTCTTMLKKCFVRFCHCGVTLFPLLSILYPFEGSHYAQPMFECELCSTSLMAECLQKLSGFFCTGHLSILLQLFVYSMFMSVWTHWYLFYTLNDNSIPFYLFIVVLGIERRASCMWGKQSTTEPHAQPSTTLFCCSKH